MEKSPIYALALFMVVAPDAWSARKNDVVTLYQVGKNGNYCLSISPNDKGCVSGSKDDGSTVNILNFIKGKDVVFENLSDAPHDMKFSGANSGDLPPQLPNGPVEDKPMTTIDMLKEKITCSFHGNQLAVGYSVLGAISQGDGTDGLATGHKKPGEGGGLNPTGNPFAGSGPAGMMGAAMASGMGSLGNIVTTGLADVSREVLAKGDPGIVANLVSARPELMQQLKQTRPLLAQQIASASANGKLIAGNAIPNGLANSALIQTGLGFNGTQASDSSSGLAGGSGAAETADSTGTAAGQAQANARLADARRRAAIERRRALLAAGQPVDETDTATDEDGIANDSRIAYAGTKFGAPSRHHTKLRGAGESWEDIDGTGPVWGTWHRWLIWLLLLVVALVVRSLVKSARGQKRAHRGHSRPHSRRAA